MIGLGPSKVGIERYMSFTIDTIDREINGYRETIQYSIRFKQQIKALLTLK